MQFTHSLDHASCEDAIYVVSRCVKLYTVQRAPGRAGRVPRGERTPARPCPVDTRRVFGLVLPYATTGTENGTRNRTEKWTRANKSPCALEFSTVVVHIDYCALGPCALWAVGLGRRWGSRRLPCCVPVLTPVRPGPPYGAPRALSARARRPLPCSPHTGTGHTAHEMPRTHSTSAPRITHRTPRMLIIGQQQHIALLLTEEA